MTSLAMLGPGNGSWLALAIWAAVAVFVVVVACIGFRQVDRRRRR